MKETDNGLSSLPCDDEPPSIYFASADGKSSAVSHQKNTFPPQININPNFKESLYSLRPSDKRSKQSWKIEYQLALKNYADISEVFSLPQDQSPKLREVIRKYKMRIPYYYLSLIQNIHNEKDPVRKQCLPSVDELENNSQMMSDPLNEEGTSPVSCLVHRYPDRALLLVTGRCFMYCRHCTRKRLWDEKIPEPTLKDFEKAVSYIKENPSIREIIISGGDPLTLSTERIERILKSLSRIKHIQVMRIGTRAPVVFPQRIDDEICSVFRQYSNLWINVQFNHPQEISPQSIEACRKLRLSGISLSNQAVLLKGINDSPQIMTKLCQKLQQIGVRPYYLFQCDPVVGTNHFRTPVWKGVEIIEKMRGHTGGMCVPTFVIDGIGGKGKIPVGPNYIQAVTEGAVKLRNYNNETFWYSWDSQDQGTKNRRPKVTSVGIVFNLKNKNSNSGIIDDDQEEYDEIETIDSLKEQIQKFGLKAMAIEQTQDFANIIRQQNIDFVLNLAEGIGSSRNRESQVPAVLDMLGIPYSGSDALTLAVTLDKFKTTQALKNAGIPVPEQYTADDISSIDKLKEIFNQDKKYIVKPRWEGSSKGIFLNSVVGNLSDLKERAAYIFDKYNEPVVVEEYLQNQEITAGVCGNAESLRLLGMMKIHPVKVKQEEFIYSIENKRAWKEVVRYEGQKTISANIRAKIEENSLRAFRALELRDVARIDFRLDKNDEPRIIDVNPLPGLSPSYSDLPILYALNNGSYSDLIKAILEEAFKRCNLLWP
ncbi:MAG: KamA family radical SAM protein [Candidatus Omnitrophica bacterium]|nr:KamA family radical SAM protein [Candidatus Omnitrophota bacterium]